MEGQIFEKNVGNSCGLGRETEKYSTQMGRQMPASRFTGDTILKLGPSASVPLLCHRSYSCSKPENPKIDGIRHGWYDGIGESHASSNQGGIWGVSTTKKEEKEIKKMSYVHAIKSFNRIVLASDSRSITIQDGNIVDYTDGFAKTTYLPGLKTGFAAAGNNVIQGKPICDFLMDLDTPRGDFQSVEDAFTSIAKEVQKGLEKNTLVNLACGGFENGIAKLLYCDIRYGEEVKVQYSNYFWHTKSAMFELFSNADKNLCVKMNAVKDMLDFSDFIVNAEIEVARFKEGIPAAGGPIQTLLLEKDGPKWIHKLF